MIESIWHLTKLERANDVYVFFAILNEMSDVGVPEINIRRTIFKAIKNVMDLKKYLIQKQKNSEEKFSNYYRNN